MEVEGHQGYQRTEVVITDIRIPFLSMVVLAIKWVIAFIPAMMILWMIMSILGLIFMALFGAAFVANNMQTITVP